MSSAAGLGVKRCSPAVAPALVESGRRGRMSTTAETSAAVVAGLAAAGYLEGKGAGLAASCRSLAHGFMGTEFGAGSIAGASSIAATYPIGKLVTRQQVDGHGAWRAGRHMWREGPRMLYQGAQPLLLQRGLQIGIMYGVFAKFHERLSRSSLTKRLRPPDDAVRFVAGMLAGSTDALVLTPLERVQTTMQLRRNKHCSLAGTGSIRGVATALAQHGPREFYRGVGTALLRNGSCTGCYFALLPHARAGYGTARSLATEHCRTTPSGHDQLGQRAVRALLPVLQSSRCEDFICGVGLGCAMSVFVFPMSTIMKRQQVQSGGEHLSMRTAFDHITARGSGSSRRLAVYRGLPAFMVKSACAWGVTNLVFTSLAGDATRSRR